MSCCGDDEIRFAVTCQQCGSTDRVGMLGAAILCARCARPGCEVCGQGGRLVLHVGMQVVMCSPCHLAAMIELPTAQMERPKQIATGPSVDLDPTGEQLWTSLMRLRSEPTTPFDPRNPWINEGGAA